ncbi:MAG TPA: UDP-glucose 4-epimerase GalE [Deinococcales bacterium]|nr:UDP-glucose 4-epimerase GalE [Deinococcales bacterium]
MRPTALITGGAGYIGSHTVRALAQAGWNATVLDNLSSGHRAALPPGVPLHQQDLNDAAATTRLVREISPDLIIHFAGAIEAGESMTQPERFYRENIVNALNLLEAARLNGVKRLVFSSSAAVYGNAEHLPVGEDEPKNPTNVYGETKLFIETALRAYGHAHGLQAIALRYFNACGADPSGEIGPDHRHKTHLLTVAILAARHHQPIQVFGTDYDTPDGTCIRDYVHVNDLASAHVLAANALMDGHPGGAYNVGLGHGHSVLQVLDAVETTSGQPLERRYAPRRHGDPAALVADPTRIQRDLGWQAQHTNLQEIVQTAWKWHEQHPNGYGDRG